MFYLSAVDVIQFRCVMHVLSSYTIHMHFWFTYLSLSGIGLTLFFCHFQLASFGFWTKTCSHTHGKSNSSIHCTQCPGMINVTTNIITNIVNSKFVHPTVQCGSNKQVEISDREREKIFRMFKLENRIFRYCCRMLLVVFFLFCSGIICFTLTRLHALAK